MDEVRNGYDAEMQMKSMLKSSLGAGTANARNSINQEKSAIEGIVDTHDDQLNTLSLLVDELFLKFSSVLNQESSTSEGSTEDTAYYGSSQLFGRLREQYYRSENLAERLRILRRLAEV